ncbi:MAG: iron-sulfur cluster assembly accessory protein [Acidobacteriota bacterium]|nr:iron-sulfur cluster assembly accessory protein [Acidobacteriota bacterium]
MKLEITPMAREQVVAAIAEEDRDDLRLRVAIVGKGPSGFQYSLDLVAPEEHPDDDIAVSLDEFTVVVDRESAEKLEGVTVDFITRLQESGFKFVNPNSMWSDPMAEAVQQVISDKINPSIAAHGGFITLLDVKDEVAYISFGGGCQGCGMADVTLKDGVRVAMKEAVPELRDVLDTTDHAAGTNPFYQGPEPDAASPVVESQGT